MAKKKKAKKATGGAKIPKKYFVKVPFPKPKKPKIGGVLFVDLDNSCYTK